MTIEAPAWSNDRNLLNFFNRNARAASTRPQDRRWPDDLEFNLVRVCSLFLRSRHPESISLFIDGCERLTPWLMASSGQILQ